MPRPPSTEWEALTLGPYTVLLDLDALGSAEAALQTAERVRGMRDSAGVAYFVRARQPAEAARVANYAQRPGLRPGLRRHRRADPEVTYRGDPVHVEFDSKA